MIKLADGLRDGSVDSSASQPLGALLDSQQRVAVLIIYLLTSAAGSILKVFRHTGRGWSWRWIALLGLVGYPLLLLGTILTAFDVTDVTHGSGQVWLALGGLFESILPIWLIAKGFTFPGSALSPLRVSPNPPRTARPLNPANLTLVSRGLIPRPVLGAGHIRERTYKRQ